MSSQAPIECAVDSTTFGEKALVGAVTFTDEVFAYGQVSSISIHDDFIRLSRSTMVSPVATCTVEIAFTIVFDTNKHVAFSAPANKNIRAQGKGNVELLLTIVAAWSVSESNEILRVKPSSEYTALCRLGKMSVSTISSGTDVTL
jgi:hypothetical protein